MFNTVIIFMTVVFGVSATGVIVTSDFIEDIGHIGKTEEKFLCLSLVGVFFSFVCLCFLLIYKHSL